MLIQRAKTFQVVTSLIPVGNKNIPHYGPATWFLTISPSEWRWTDLADYIKLANGPDATNKSTSELVAMDPVSASRFIDIRFKSILNFLTSPEAPSGKIEHYFWRREYQSRGLQHFHLMLWVKDAPILQVSTIEEVAEFINKYVTFSAPDKKVSPTLHHRIVNYQMHKHNSYKKQNQALQRFADLDFHDQ